MHGDYLIGGPNVAPAGTVIGQDPRSGTEVLTGSTVNLRISGPLAEGPDDPWSPYARGWLIDDELTYSQTRAWNLPTEPLRRDPLESLEGHGPTEPI